MRSFKKFLAFSLALLLLAALCLLPAAADFDAHDERLVDYAGLLDDLERTRVVSRLDEISEKLQFELVVVIVEDITEFYDTDNNAYYSRSAFADDFYDYHNYGYGKNYDGALLLLETYGRAWYISTCGEGQEAIDVGELSEYFIDYLRMDDYASAFIAFANSAGDAVESYRSFHIGTKLVIALLIGLIVALAVTGSMKRKLHTVQSAVQANDYIRSGSLNITAGNELFLYSTVSRVRRESSSSSSGRSHTSSSGRSHGGGGGHY